jgi:hypothetical protein
MRGRVRTGAFTSITRKYSLNLGHPPANTSHSPNRERNSTGVRRRRNIVSICVCP